MVAVRELQAKINLGFILAALFQKPPIKSQRKKCQNLLLSHILEDIWLLKEQFTYIFVCHIYRERNTEAYKILNTFKTIFLY